MNRSLRRVFAVLALALLCTLPTYARSAARPAESFTENVFSTLWDIVRVPLRLFQTQATIQKDGPIVSSPPPAPTTNSCPPAGCPPDGDGQGGIDPNG